METMDLKQENGVAGEVPEFGAIFMSNVATKRECFRQKVFGLPSAHANFVKQVKAGTILFLFEFEKRELFGVFQACSDGAMNIVPNAFSSSRNHFPAQVRFTTIWYCSPLSENEFRDVIRNNYFTKKKFNFGLSEEQAHRLLWLFSSRKLNDKLSQRQLRREATRPFGKNRRTVDDDDDGLDIEPNAGKGVKLDTLSEDLGNSLNSVKRDDDDRFLMVNLVDNEHKVADGFGQSIRTDYAGDYLGDVKRVNNDNRFLVGDMTGYEHNDHYGLHKAVRNEHTGNSFGKIRRLGDNGQFMMDDRVENEGKMDYNVLPSVTTVHGTSSDELRRITDDGMFLMRNRIGNECNTDNGFGLVVSNNHLQKPSNKARLATADGGFLVNDSVDNEHNVDNGLEPVISTVHLGNLLGKVRRVTNDSRFSVNEGLHQEQRVDNCSGPVISTELLGSPLVRGKAADDSRFLSCDRVDSKHNLDIGLVPRISTKRSGNSWDELRKTSNVRRFLTRERVGNEHNTDNSLGPTFSKENFGYALGDGRQVADGLLRKSDGVTNGREMDNSLRPTILAKYIAFGQNPNPLVYSSKPALEKDYSLLQDEIRNSEFNLSSKQQNFGLSYRTSHDAIVTRAVPYDPKFPNICDRSPASFSVEHRSSLVQDPCYNCSEGNLFSSSNCKSLPLHLDRKDLSRCSDVPRACVNKRSLPFSDNHHDYSYGRVSSYFLNPGYRENMDLDFSAREGYKSPVFSDPSLASSASQGEIFLKESRGPLPYAFNSSTHSSFEFDDRYPVALQGDQEHEILWNDRNESFTTEGFPSSDVMQYDTCSEAQGRYYHGKDPSNHDNEYNKSSERYSGFKNNRTSVFARLKSAADVCIQEEDDTHVVYDEYDMGASVDEVMDMLHQGRNDQGKKMKKKYKSLVQQHDDIEIARNKKETKVINRIEYDKSTMKMELDANHPIEESSDQKPKEAQVVDFRRRSEKKKILDESSTKTFAENAEGEGLVGKQGKRRKLVRPVFGRRESSDEGISHVRIPILQLLSHECSPSKGKICEDSVKCFENNDLSSHIVASMYVTPSTGCDGKGVDTQHSSNCKGKRTLDNRGVSSKGPEGEYGNELPQKVSILNTNREIPSTPNVGSGLKDSIVDQSSQDLLGNTGYCSNAEESPPAVCEVIAGPGNCRGDENLFPRVEIAKNLSSEL